MRQDKFQCSLNYWGKKIDFSLLWTLIKKNYIILTYTVCYTHEKKSVGYFIVTDIRNKKSKKSLKISYILTLTTLAVVPKCTHFLESYFEIIVLGWICSVHCWMLHALNGNGFDCLFAFVSIKMEHPQPLHVWTNVCIIYAVKENLRIHFFNLVTLKNTHAHCTDGKTKKCQYFWST